jgi:hypothetical protein
MPGTSCSVIQKVHCPVECQPRSQMPRSMMVAETSAIRRPSTEMATRLTATGLSGTTQPPIRSPWSKSM